MCKCLYVIKHQIVWLMPLFKSNVNFFCCKSSSTKKMNDLIDFPVHIFQLIINIICSQCSISSKLKPNQYSLFVCSFVRTHSFFAFISQEKAIIRIVRHLHLRSNDLHAQIMAFSCDFYSRLCYLLT